MNKCCKTTSGSSESHNGEVQHIRFTVNVLLTHFGSILHSRDKPRHVTWHRLSHNTEDSTNLQWYFFLIKDILLCFDSKSKTECSEITVKTQQWCIYVSILLWQHVLVLLEHLQASLQRYEVQSVHIMYCGILYYLQGVHKKEFKIIINYIYIKSC